MTNLIGDGNGAFKSEIRQLETTDPRHPDTWNPNNQDLITNDVLLKNKQDLQQSEIEAARGGELNVNARFDKVEGDVNQITVDTNLIGQHGKAIDSIKAFSQEAIIYDIPTDVELFNVTVAVAGDNTIDVVDTSDVLAGQSYFMIEGPVVEEIKVANVLTGTRFITVNNLVNSFSDAAIMTRISGAFLITKQHPGKACYLFVSGSSDLAVNILREDGANWVAVTAEANGGYYSYGPVRFKVEVTAGVLSRVGLSGLPVLQDQETGNNTQYILEMQGGTLIQRGV